MVVDGGFGAITIPGTSIGVVFTSIGRFGWLVYGSLLSSKSASESMAGRSGASSFASISYGRCEDPLRLTAFDSGIAVCVV